MSANLAFIDLNEHDQVSISSFSHVLFPMFYFLLYFSTLNILYIDIITFGKYKL